MPTILIVACAILRKMLSTTCEKTTVWQQFLLQFYQVQSVIFYLLQSYDTNNFYQRTSSYFASCTEWIWKIASFLSAFFFGTFQPKVDKIFYFYQHYPAIHGQMQRKNLKFIHGVDFELIENLPNNGTNYLLIFDEN